MQMDARREINEAKALLERLVLSFGMRHQPRFTMDAPIRTSVWTAYAGDPNRAISLILVPTDGHPTQTTVETLTARLDGLELEPEDARLLALPTSIHVWLNFEQAICAAVPMTKWWGDGIFSVAVEFIADVNAVLAGGSPNDLVTKFRAHSDKDTWRMFAIVALIGASPRAGAASGAQAAVSTLRQWRYIGKMAGILMRLGGDEFGGEGFNVEDDTNTADEANEFAHDCMAPGIKYLQRLGDRITALDRQVIKSAKGLTEATGEGIWSINLNRPVELAIHKSRKAVKADAAIKVFEDQTDGLTWAVIDSGIDASHPAFADRSSKTPTSHSAATSRIKATYDFTRLHHLLRYQYSKLVSPADLKALKKEHRWTAATTETGKRDPILSLLYARHRLRARMTPSQKALKKALQNKDFRGEVNSYLAAVKRNVVSGRMIDWAVVEPLIAVAHDEAYQVPGNPHGTHVAGILAGDAPADELETDAEWRVSGVCPKLSLYDLRVCDAAGRGEEFIVQAALQFIAHLNRNRDATQVHGINISLSIRHDVATYACGQTPVCVECERLIGDGVVVVAAAGNKGFQKLSTENGLIDAYNAISITDPGNAEGVITVGATHRNEPHSFGVSYFSSRGPTGDGREKPDLVAPGEKIVAPVPGRKLDKMDGTSMAAPHVSGAAAMLMARHKELVGRPKKIKQILCNTATDLGRRREFQGAGMVDILRALQSV